jgi:hypothetical protein
MKNRIINGAMVVNQRNAGVVANLTTDTFSVDRFRMVGSVASKFTGQQSTTAPAGFNNSLLITSSSAYTVGSAERFVTGQYIEGYNVADLGWGTANAKTVTLSFQVYSSLTGTFGGAIRNSAGDRSYPFSYTISSASTWTSISVTIAGDTSGTWLTDNNAGMNVAFNLGSGSTLLTTGGAWASGSYFGTTGSVSLVGTNTATLYITGVQLEVGSSATGYEYRQYGQELALCQRYYISAASGTLVSPAAGTYVSAQFPVNMRSAPTVVCTPVISNSITTVNGFTGTFAGLSGVAYTASIEL